MDLKITPSGQTIVKPTALGPGANTDTKLLIYGLFQKGRVLAQDGIYPYRLRDRPITRPNHVWGTDVTYIPLQRGFLYLVAAMAAEAYTDDGADRRPGLCPGSRQPKVA